jgi:CRISPR-associated protein Csd1
MGKRGGEKMILQALYDYYQRKAVDPESGIAPEGFALKRIDFVVVLSVDGSFVELQSLQEPNGKKLIGKPFFVPAIGKQAEKHTMAGNDANLLWDNAGFVFGIGGNGEKKRKSFLECIKKYYQKPPEDVFAIISYLENELKSQTPFSALLNHPLYGEQIATGSPIVTFNVGNDFTPITERDHVKNALMSVDDSMVIKGNCLITGDLDVPLALNHMVTKRIVGAQSSGSNLVSFNAPAYCSYGKESSINSPVSILAANAYAKALQYLIDSGKNSVRLVDTTTVFWAQKQDVFEEDFPAFFGYRKDNPDADVRAVKALYEGFYTGHAGMDSDARFYVLGLAPNSARISVRFWLTGTIDEFAGNIKRHFDDLDIVRPSHDNGRYSLYWLLLAMVREIDNVPPNCFGSA